MKEAATQCAPRRDGSVNTEAGKRCGNPEVFISVAIGSRVATSDAA
jgi:hypothetical protein